MPKCAGVEFFVFLGFYDDAVAATFLSFIESFVCKLQETRAAAAFFRNSNRRTNAGRQEPRDVRATVEDPKFFYRSPHLLCNVFRVSDRRIKKDNDEFLATVTGCDIKRASCRFSKRFRHLPQPVTVKVPRNSPLPTASNGCPWTISIRNTAIDN